MECLARVGAGPAAASPQKNKDTMHKSCSRRSSSKFNTDRLFITSVVLFVGTVMFYSAAVQAQPTNPVQPTRVSGGGSVEVFDASARHPAERSMSLVVNASPEPSLVSPGPDMDSAQLDATAFAYFDEPAATATALPDMLESVNKQQMDATNSIATAMPSSKVTSRARRSSPCKKLRKSLFTALFAVVLGVAVAQMGYIFYKKNAAREVPALSSKTLLGDKAPKKAKDARDEATLKKTDLGPLAGKRAGIRGAVILLGVAALAASLLVPYITSSLSAEEEILLQNLTDAVDA